MHTVSAVVLGLVVALPVTAAVAGSGNDRCVNTTNNDARQVVQAALKHDRVCVQRATTSNVTACVDGSDPKTDLKKSKLASDYAAVCSGNVPIFGLATGGVPVINAAAESAANKVTHDLFGATVNVGTDTLQRCQEKVEQRLGNLSVTIWREFRDCKRKNLANLAGSAALASTCLGAPNGMQPDPKSKIARRQERLAGDIQKHCVDRGINPGQAAFPGLCSASSNAAFAQCIGRQARCRLCEGIKSADGFGSELNCDRFDDGLGNFSCGPAPVSTPTRTPTSTHTPTLTPTATLTVTPSLTPQATATATLPAICESIVDLPPIAQVPVTLLQGASQCGGVGLTNPTPGPPHAGSVRDGSNTQLAPLSLGCLYTGGLPPLLLPYGSSTEVSVVGLQLLPSLALTLGASAGSGPADCTLGAGPGRSCANGAPGVDGNGTCSFDSDCGGQTTSCALDANCYFGPPIPVPNGGLSACVMNAFLTDICGQVTLLPPAATFHAALNSRVYLTFDAASPCPRCEAPPPGGGEAVCTGGERAGLACTASGSAGTSADCPPLARQFLSTLTVVIPALTSGSSTLTASDGLFCSGQSVPGAMGLSAARTVTEQGSGPTLPLLSTTLTMDVAGVFCIEPTGTFLDAIAGLPAVGALSTGAGVDLTNVLP